MWTRKKFVEASGEALLMTAVSCALWLGIIQLSGFVEHQREIGSYSENRQVKQSSHQALPEYK